MGTESNILERSRKAVGLDKYGIPILIVLMLSLIIAVIYYTQSLSEQNSQPPIPTTGTKEQYEIAKLAAEIRQIRSDTTGSLFWLKMIALFVTVGGAVGGYLVGQKQTTKQRLEFENLKNIDAVYQGIILELADRSPLRRAAAAVRLGMILKSFPSEWVVDDVRKEQIVQLTKQVMAASLSIEKDRKVLKTLTIALALHKRWEDASRITVDRASSVFVATIPFVFHSGDKVLSPGEYSVAITAPGNMLVVSGRDSKAEIRLSPPVVTSAEPEIEKLVFHRYGKTYYLAEVWASQLPRSGQKRELKAHSARKSWRKRIPANADEVVEILDRKGYADVRGLDLSGAKAADAYWARVEFSSSDFYRADLTRASFRASGLQVAQFREAKLQKAVLAMANCEGANFKFADLRDADLRKAKLLRASFEGAKVFGCKLEGAELGDNPEFDVDNSEQGNGPMIPTKKWLAEHPDLVNKPPNVA